MIMAAILSIVIVTTVTVAIGLQTGAGSNDSAAARLSPEAASPKRRRRAARRSGIRHSVGSVRPQYLPALARARVLRSQVSSSGITTPHGHQMR
jgi:hypothetical protein